MAEVGKYTTVSVPTDLAAKCRDHIEGTGFKNLSDYVTYILREIVASKNEWDKAETQQDKRVVMEKLRKLGYL